MYTLSYPWLLLLVLLPPLLRRLLPAYRESRRALGVPWFQRMADLLGQRPSRGAVIAQARWFNTRLFGPALNHVQTLSARQPAPGG